jgi:hypothetical protein
MEVGIEGRCNHSAQIVNMKTNLLREDRETEVVVTEEFDMETQSTASQAGLEGEGDRIFHQTEQKCQKVTRRKKDPSGLG